MPDSADDPDDADKPDELDVQSESALPFVSTILNFSTSNKQWIGSAICVPAINGFSLIHTMLEPRSMKLTGPRQRIQVQGPVCLCAYINSYACVLLCLVGDGSALPSMPTISLRLCGCLYLYACVYELVYLCVCMRVSVAMKVQS